MRGFLGDMKKGKATGPDNIEMELLQKLPDNAIEDLTRIINDWFNNGVQPEGITEALVATIFKKGDPKLQENYRPISLLNAIYKLTAAMVKHRIEEGADRELQKTQYGFRAGRRTTQAIYCIRRVMDNAERRGRKLGIALLDWENIRQNHS